MDAEQLLREPTDEFFTNVYIYGQIQMKEEMDTRNGIN